MALRVLILVLMLLAGAFAAPKRKQNTDPEADFWKRALGQTGRLEIIQTSGISSSSGAVVTSGDATADTAGNDAARHVEATGSSKMQRALETTIRFMRQYGENAEHTQADFENMGLALENQLSQLSGTETEQLLHALQQHFAETPGTLQQEMLLRLMAQSHICDVTGGRPLDSIDGNAKYLIDCSLVRTHLGHQALRRGIEGFASPAGPSKGGLSHNMRVLCMHRSWTSATAATIAQLRAERVDLCLSWIRNHCCPMRSFEDMTFSLRAWNTEASCSVAALAHQHALRLEGIASPATDFFEEPASAEVRHPAPHACPILCCLFPRSCDAWVTALTCVLSTVISSVAQKQCAVAGCIGTSSCCACGHRFHDIRLLASSSAAFDTETSCMPVVCNPGALRRRAWCSACYNFVLSCCTSPTMQIGKPTCRAELMHVYYAAVAGRLTQSSRHAGLALGCRFFGSFALWPLASEGKWSLRFRHPSCGKLVRVLKIALNTPRHAKAAEHFRFTFWLEGFASPRRYARALLIHYCNVASRDTPLQVQADEKPDYVSKVVTAVQLRRPNHCDIGTNQRSGWQSMYLVQVSRPESSIFQAKSEVRVAVFVAREILDACKDTAGMAGGTRLARMQSAPTSSLGHTVGPSCRDDVLLSAFPSGGIASSLDVH